LHDSIRFEGQGIPAVAIATHEFRTAARAQASALGRPDFEPVYVPHPIQDQTREEIEAKADAAIAEVVSRLVVCRTGL
jgi:hypothetical protein